MASRAASGPRTGDRSSTRWWPRIVGALFTLIGAVLAAGGLWLVLLGGSWYYLPAGLGLIITGVLLVSGNRLGLWVYLVVWALTLLWAVWEVGLQLWPLVPRVVAPTVLLLLLLTTLPMLKGASQARWVRGRTAAGAAAAIALLIGGTSLVGPVLSQDDTSSAESAGGGDGDARDTTTIAATGVDVPTSPVATHQVGEDWPAYGGTREARRYSPLDQITPDNVGQLERVWTYRTGDMPGQEAEGKYSPENTPIKVGDRLYVCSPMNIMIAVDAASGEEIWRYDPGVPVEAIPYGATCRGVAYHEDQEASPEAACSARVIEATLDARLIAVDAQTGEPCSDFGQGGEVDLNVGIGQTVPGWYAVTSPPVVVRGIVVTGAQVKDGQAEDAPSGVIRGYDARTGELAWAWDMCRPDLTGAPPDGEVYSRGTPNMWTMAAGDEELGHVYLPLGNSAVDYWGANRADCENAYSTALVAIDVTTGKPVWDFQTVHYDVWDYDLGSQPSLIDFPGDNGTVPAILLPSKQGPLYVLNRETGEPLVGVEEREVPSGGVEPQNLSPTQPYSSYATLAQPPLTEADMWGMSPLDQLWCRIQFHRASYEGEYTPPSAGERWIQYPGYNGGSDWGSVAVDPERGLIVANYNDMPNFNRLVPRDVALELGVRPIDEGGNMGGHELGAQAGSPFAIDVNAGWRIFTGLLCKQPPYGRIRGIELASGDTLWDHAFGTAENNGPFGIPSMLPVRIGTPNNGGPIVTAGGLAFVAATTDNNFRAIDVETGEVLWQDPLPAGGQTTPLTYAVDGRQYVVIAPGGHHFMETEIGDYVIAYALPEDAA